MHDIRLAVALIALISIAAFSLTYRLTRSRTNRFLDFAAVVLVLLIIAHGYLMYGQLWVVQWIPLPSVPVLANWFPPLMGALAAVVWRRLGETSVARRVPVMVLIVGAAAYSILYLVPIRAPKCENKWVAAEPPMIWPVCLQTTPMTCSAASAATILNCLGISTSEQEMARLCLTRNGSTWLGIYHGLASKLLRHDHYVQFFSTTPNGLADVIESGPALLCCRLDPQIAKMAPQFVNEGGWIPGAAHSVVYFGMIGDRHVIGDPAMGYEAWTTKDLNLLWTGEGLKIIQLDRPIARSPRLPPSDGKPSQLATALRTCLLILEGWPSGLRHGS